MIPKDRMEITSWLMLALAIPAILFAWAIWYTFLRPVPESSGIGVITDKSFRPARTIQRYETGPRRESFGQDKIVIPDGYLFDVRVEGLPATLQYSMPALEAGKYSLGQRVLVRYVERGLPMLHKRIQVTQMVPADPRPVP